MTDPHPAVASFVTEARDLLEGLEDMLLDLELDSSQERVDAVFRTLHTIKGSGAMFGFTTLARFTHHFEEAFDRVREGRLLVGRRLINLSLKARDHMTALLECGGDGVVAEALEAAPEAHALVAALNELLVNEPIGEPSGNKEYLVSPDGVRRWTIVFRPAADALRNGMRPDLLLAELCGFGPSSVRLISPEVPDLQGMDPTACHIGWEIELATSRSQSEIESVFIFADDADLLIIPKDVAHPGHSSRIDKTLEPGEKSPDDTEKSAAVPLRSRSSELGRDSVRVPANKLDELIDQLGELVIVQSRLHQIAITAGNPELENVVEEVERLVTGLRDATLSIRMLPIEVVFGKFRRVVRDLSAELGKDVELVTEGGETELDKNVIDRLSEPLVHMIRNAIDHGIEPADVRRRMGKPPQGTVTLSARQEGGEVLISIVDDGGGLDTDAIRLKAIERGIIAEDSQLSVPELHQLIFAPGFSTARTLSSVSGRGVGMDAVRTAVDSLRGTVEIHSLPGGGTHATLRLPVTLAIIDGLLVRLGDGVFVIPLSAVEECVEPDESERNRASGRSMLRIREHLVAFLELNTVFGLPSSAEANRRVVVVRTEGHKLGLVVDDILGLNQTVIKALSAYHRDIPGLSGATILGDGTVALILDVVTLWRSANGMPQRSAA